MDVINYGKALYYPYISFNNKNWLKTAALFYNELARIVPPGYAEFTDKELIKQFNDDEAFITDVSPTLDAFNAGLEFIKFFKRELFDTNQRQKYLYKLGSLLPRETPITIHDQKISQVLKEELFELGLISRNVESDFFAFEPVTGAMYMTYLANEVAKRERLPIVTDDPAFQPLIYGAQQDELGEVTFKRNDTAFNLGALVITCSIPDDISKISIKKILTFRRNHQEQMYTFYNELNSLVSDLANIDLGLKLNEVLEYRKKGIEVAAKNLEASYKSINITTSNALLALSVPAVASTLGTGIAAAGIIAVGAGKVALRTSDARKLQLGNPYSYVLSLRKLKSRTLLEQRLSGSVIL